MGLRGWFRRRPNSPAEAWRERWQQATRAGDAAAAAELRASLANLGDDVELEHEMLDGLDRLIALSAELHAGRIPRVETTHRVIGADACHFSAPASLPDDPAQPSGRVLLTSARAVFVGGSRREAVPWHGIRGVVRGERDVLLIRSADDALRVRFNTFGDALAAAALGNHLKRRRPL
jgi:hypothetical protein